MAVKLVENQFGTEKQVLAIPDHYVALPYKLSKGSSLAVDVQGRKIVKAGTVFPSNDGAAVGVVMHDYDVTDGDQQAAIILHGFIKLGSLPVAPSAAAEAALTSISFLPYRRTVLDVKANFNYEAGADAEVYVRVSGTRFKTDSPTLTIDAGATGLTLTFKSMSPDKKLATYTAKGTVAPGKLTISGAETQFVNNKASNEAVLWVDNDMAQLEKHREETAEPDGE